MEDPSVNPNWNPVSPDPRPARPFEMIVRVLCLFGIALVLVVGAVIGLAILFLASNPSGFHV
jgi:hypothetical protein